MNERPRSRKRLYVLMTVAALIIPGALGYIGFYLFRPIGEGAAGPSIDATAFSET